MQMPILNYPNFCHLLQLHQQNAPMQQRPSALSAMSETSAEAETSASNSRSPSHSPSNSPPLCASDKLPPGKSFTIDAILGLNDARPREPLTFHSAFHPRLTMSLQATTNHPGAAASYTHPVLKDKYGGEGNKKCSGKSKRVRTIFTPEQLERLEGEFERQQYMVGPERLYLAHTLQLTEAQVKVWFQNRRIKWRKQHLEIQQQRLAVLKDNARGAGDDDVSMDSDDSSTAPRYSAFVQDSPQQMAELVQPSTEPVREPALFLDHH